MQPPNSFFGVKVSKNGIPVNQASDKQLVYKDDFSTKTYYDNTTARMLEGLLPDGSYGLWVSKPGVDVTTASSDNLIFNSNQNIFKIVGSGTASVTVPNPFPGATTLTATVPHTLGFPPAFLAYLNTPLLVNPDYPSNTILNMPWMTGGTGAITLIAQSRSDSNNLYFDIINNLSGAISDVNGIWQVKYYILQETATAS